MMSIANLNISIGHWITIHVVLVLAGLIIYTASTHLLKLRRIPSVAISWVIGLVLLPYVMLPLYLVFGFRKIKVGRSDSATPTSIKQAPQSGDLADRTQQLATAMGLPVASAYHALNIHENGTQSLDALRQMIDAATSTIDICTFIFASDNLGEEIAQQLKQKAKSGIKIRLLIDGVGTYLSNHINLKSLAADGIQVELFSPIVRMHIRGRTNLRNHRKMVIVDRQWFWAGGRNIAAEYFEGVSTSKNQKQAWVDLTFDLKGDLAIQAQQRFEQDWFFATTGKLEEVPISLSKKPNLTGNTGQIIASGPDQVDDTFYSLLISSIFESRKTIMLVTPYFVPDSALMMALTLAARKGVEVDIIMPKKSNHLLADLSRHRALREVTLAGVKVWFLPRMIHAKTMVVDDSLAFVGSANLDQRSLFLNYELMFSFYRAKDVKRFGQWIKRQQKDAVLYRAESPGFLRDVLEGLLLWLAFQL